ncbi:hypothetical protein IK112_01870 [Candidatus Saccharibacteria bacterium]|nr:hypothetical protein [Candidatus Saccharibacteria bacterium]
MVLLSCSIFTFSRRYPLSYVWSGQYGGGNGKLGNQGEYGFWWSSMALGQSQARRVYLNYDNGLETTEENTAITKYNALALHYIFISFTSARRYPLSYVFFGYYYWGNGNLVNQDSGGYWWSTAAYSDSNAYYLGMNSSLLYPQYNNNKAYGFALRLYIVYFVYVCYIEVIEVSPEFSLRGL